MLRREFLLSLPLSLVSCVRYEDCRDGDDDCRDRRRHDPNPNEPTPVPEPEPEVHTVDFRVTGEGTAEILYTSSIEGTGRTNTILPWTSTLRTTEISVFLSITATFTGIGTVAVQLFIDGRFFREALATAFDEFTPAVATISGTFSLI
jgi:hypothetical protein